MLQKRLGNRFVTAILYPHCHASELSVPLAVPRWEWCKPENRDLGFVSHLWYLLHDSHDPSPPGQTSRSFAHWTLATGAVEDEYIQAYLSPTLMLKAASWNHFLNECGNWILKNSFWCDSGGIFYCCWSLCYSCWSWCRWSCWVVGSVELLTLIFGDVKLPFGQLFPSIV